MGAALKELFASGAVSRADLFIQTKSEGHSAGVCAPGEVSYASYVVCCRMLLGYGSKCVRVCVRT